VGSVCACGPGFWDWLLFELSAGRALLPWCGSKEARAHQTRIRNALHGLHTNRKGQYQMTIMIGIDPHKATHTAVAIDGDEEVLDEFTLRSSSVQVRWLRAWAGQFDDTAWAVESARGLGYLLSQQLVAAGETVFDVPPVLASRVRVLGSGRSQKNDPNDARSVAIAALRSDRLTRVVPDDHAQVLRLLVKRHRDNAKLRARQMVRLSALLCELQPGGTRTKTTPTKANELLDTVTVCNEVSRTRVMIARELLDDVTQLDTMLRASKARLGAAVAVSGTSVCDIVGIGPICAATIIGYTGDIQRFPSKAHFAMYNATAPLEASSGARSVTGSTSEGTVNSTSRSISQRLSRSELVVRAACSTTAKSARARATRKRSAR